jgi:hypothetical protein
MTTNQLPIIILVDERDDITHTAEWPQCKDSSCPCNAQDVIADVPPTSAELDRQEQIELLECHYCSRLKPFPQFSYWPLCANCQARLEADIQRQAAQIRNATRQTDDGSWW